MKNSEWLSLAWSEACWGLGIAPDVGARDDLVDRYDQPRRRYHSLAHIASCVRHFDDHRALAARPSEVLAALLFHDAVYDPTRTDNEDESARLARSALSGADPAALDRIADSILATRKHNCLLANDAALVVDIDLAILGAAGETYDVFEREIREEYAFVPEEAFRAGRRAVLERFLKRERIYVHDALWARWEDRARANLRRALTVLA